jgi:hypothetical protein
MRNQAGGIAGSNAEHVKTAADATFCSDNSLW